MSDEKLDLSALEGSIESLEDGLDVVGDSTWFGAQKSAVRNTLVAGVIQNFEFVYEISIEMTMRNITAHTYDHEKARQVYEGTLDFIRDARALLTALRKRNG